MGWLEFASWLVIGVFLVYLAHRFLCVCNAVEHIAEHVCEQFEADHEEDERGDW